MKQLLRTEEIYLKHNNILSNLCHNSKNLYNEANYIIRQEFFNKHKWISYNELDKLMQPSENYKALPAQSAQYTLQLLDKAWKGFFNSLKSFKKTPEKFKAKPKPPQYLNKDGEFLIKINNRTKIKNNTVTLPKKLNNIQIKTRLPDNTNIREYRIIPKGTGYVFEIVYIKEVEIKERDKTRIIGIDLGLSNIVTIANNIGEIPIIIKDDGRGIKSINQYYNKEKAHLKSISDRQEIKTTKRQQRLYDKRQRKANNYTHKLSRFIVNYCLKHNIGRIIFGYNQEWKQNINMGKRNNQNFALVPYADIINKTTYKAEELNIEVRTQQESHTIKCSFLDSKSIEHHDKYVGNRISRGLFKSSNGTLINADVNGAYNIIRKSEPNAFADGVGGCELHPIRLSIYGDNIL